jgi:DNA-binding NarL/FixJ family response regulator
MWRPDPYADGLDGSLNVLLIEDDPRRHEVFLDLLEGHRVTVVATSTGGLTETTQSAYGLVLLDLDLADGVGKGVRVAEALSESASATAHLIVHSMNICWLRDAGMQSPVFAHARSSTCVARWSSTTGPKL